MLLPAWWMLILRYKVSFTYDRLGRCFRFVYIYACIVVVFVAIVSWWIKIDTGAANLWDPWDVPVVECHYTSSEFYNNFVDIYLPTISATLPATLPSVLWRCWLGGRKGIRHVKNGAVGCWRGYLSGARCRLAYGPADATATHCLLLQHKSRLVLPFWYRLTRVVPDKGPLNGGVRDSNITAERGGGVDRVAFATWCG